MTESELQTKVADYIKLQYPNVLFHSDYGSGVKLTARQAAIQKRQNGGRRSWPDMFIAEPRIARARINSDSTLYMFPHARRTQKLPPVEVLGGLFIELKKEGTRLKKKNGDWATPHIEEQADMLNRLQLCGYRAVFAVGFDEAKRIIDEYLGGPQTKRVEF